MSWWMQNYNNRVRFQGEMGTGTGGAGNKGSVPNAGNKPNEGENNNNQNDGNNQDNFDLNAGNIWEQPDNSKKNSNPNGNGNGNQQTNNGTQPDAMEGFNNYVNKLDFKFALSPESVQKFIQQGDHKGLSDAITASHREVYRQTMLDASKMLNTSIEKAVNSAVEKATGAYKTDKAVDYLNTSIPIAKNPNVAPVAQAAYGAFLKAGKSQEDAVKGVRDFLSSIKSLKNEDLGLPKAPSGSPGNGRLRESGQQSDTEDMVDWLAFAKS